MILDEKFIDKICIEQNELNPMAIRVALFLYKNKYLDSNNYRKLPKTRIIGNIIGINRATVHKALTRLENCNVIKRKGLKNINYKFDDEFKFVDSYIDIVKDFSINDINIKEIETNLNLEKDDYEKIIEDLLLNFQSDKWNRYMSFKEYVKSNETCKFGKHYDHIEGNLLGDYCLYLKLPISVNTSLDNQWYICIGINENGFFNFSDTIYLNIKYTSSRNTISVIKEMYLKSKEILKEKLFKK